MALLVGVNAVSQHFDTKIVGHADDALQKNRAFGVLGHIVYCVNIQSNTVEVDLKQMGQRRAGCCE